MQEKHNKFVNVGKAPHLESTYSIVLYDPDNGNVLYVHSVLFLGKSSTQNPDSIEKEAVAHANSFGLPVAKLKVLHTNEEIEGMYKIDLDKHILVKQPYPKIVHHQSHRT